jgi:hypothetical protein
MSQKCNQALSSGRVHEQYLRKRIEEIWSKKVVAAENVNLKKVITCLTTRLVLNSRQFPRRTINIISEDNKVCTGRA